MSELNQQHGKREAAPDAAQLKRRKKLLIGLGIAAGVILLLLLLLRLWVRVPSLPKPEDDGMEGSGITDMSNRKKGVFTFLLAGRDVASGSTDTMLLLTYDVKAKTIHGLNLPRDTMINTDTRSKRLNAVYSYTKGDDPDNYVRNGMNGLRQAVQKLTGIYPDFYVLVEWEAIGELVDALGGVEFEVPFDMDYDDPAQNLHIHQAAGLRKLDGEDAMEVIRHRKNNDGSHSLGDVGRLEVQQDFLKAVAKECLKPATFLKLPDLAEVFTNNVETNLSVGNIIAFAEKAMGMDPDTGVTFETAPIAEGVRWHGAALVLLDGEPLVELLNNGMNPYKAEIRLEDLELVIRSGNGYDVTSGTLADPSMAGGGGSRPQPRPEPVPEPPAQPETPAEPENPAEPEAPVDPEAPAEPENPAEPETPAEPEAPVEPGTPAEPETPVEPEPTEPQEPGEPSVEPEVPVEPEPQPEPVPQPEPEIEEAPARQAA